MILFLKIDLISLKFHCMIRMLSIMFRNALDAVFRNGIAELGNIDALNERMKKQWKYEDDFNFLYGRTIGYYEMVAKKMFRDAHDREAIGDEIDEMNDILETHALEIKEIFEKFKQ